MALSPEAEVWLDAAWPIGRHGEDFADLAARLFKKGWRRGTPRSPRTLVSPARTRYTITQGPDSLLAQRTP